MRLEEMKVQPRGEELKKNTEEKRATAAKEQKGDAQEERPLAPRPPVHGTLEISVLLRLQTPFFFLSLVPLV